MKKELVVFVAFCMLFSFCACTPQVDDSTTQTTAAAPQLQAGFGEANITPTESVPLQGYGDGSERMSTGITSYLYAHILAVTDDQGTTAMMISVDNAALGEQDVVIRKGISEEYGVPVENILISACHQHSTPDHSYSEIPSSGRYSSLMYNKIVKAVGEALEDRAPAQMYITTVQTEGLNFVRNYVMNDGTMYDGNHGTNVSGYSHHESEADSSMQLLKFVREGAKPILVTNFQTHPHLGSGGSNYFNAHSDLVGVYRETVAEELGCHVMYFSGASGNINPWSEIESENRTRDYKQYGKLLAQYAIDAEGTYTPVESGAVKTKQVTIEYDTDHSMDHLVGMALEINAIRSEKGNAAAAEKAQEYYPMIQGIHHANAIIIKRGLDATKPLLLTVIGIGEVAFTAHPYEMFDTNGMELKNGTLGNENYAPEDQLDNPYAMTIVTTLSNGWEGYIPSQLGYTNGGYSTDITRFASGTGEKLVTDYLKLINEIHSAG